METQRGRSPSSGHHASARHTPSPSPAASYNNNNNSSSSVSGVPFDHDSGLFTNPDYTQQQQQQQQQQLHQQQQRLASSSASQPAFDGSIDFTSGAPSFFPDQSLPQGDASGLDFASQGSNAFPDFTNFDPTAALNELNDPSFDAPLFSSTGDNQFSLNSAAVDPILLGTADSNHHSPMATQTQSPTPPHLLAPGMNRQASGSPHSSPAMAQGAFQPPPLRHSRNSSLDPSSAAFPQMQQQQQQQGPDWGAGMAFQGHRRTYSDAHSDISSAHASPYLATHDSFDGQHSPNLAPQDPIMFQEVMGLSHVSLAEASTSYISPAHSPHISPRLNPSVQHHSPSFPPVDHFNLVPGMPSGMNNQFNGQANHMFQATTQDSFPQLNQPTTNADYPGHADAMTPPEINIQLAPPSRTSSFEPQNKMVAPEGALSPPEKFRGRAKSDPFSSRGTTPSRDALSPHAAGVGSRSPSPSSKSRRSSTSSVPNRDYILDLADPSRPASGASDNSGGNSSKRTQKHPATFQCSLCPKRFTRAYNLRSHLRTHTDERPFVCSVCGKAFARQHDRKRHEGLHSGEKKFVCKGQLKDSNSWGCGRRFARADALGRHFRSEAGRVCIKPLMDEEAIERGNHEQAAANAAASSMPGMMPGMMPGQSMMQSQSGFEYPVGHSVPGNFDPGMQMAQQPQMPYRLPQALLQQYPTLGGIWDQLPANGPDEIEDINGRSSFDASSAGEYDDEGDYGHQGGAYGWASDVGP